MNWPLDWLPRPDELLALPVEDVAMFLLKRIARKPHHSFRADHFTGMNAEILPYVESSQQTAVAAAFGEAWDWLYTNGLLVGSPEAGERDRGSCRISRKGLATAEEVEPIRLLRAERLLAGPLHPAISDKARLLFGIGEYEAAVLMAFRELEIRVRGAGPFGVSDLGPDLMRKAFNPDNPGLLADPELHAGERKAVADLYAGGMGAFKNPLSHRTVDYADPTIAAEQLLFADLLHRMLDGFEAAKAERDKVT